MKKNIQTFYSGLFIFVIFVLAPIPVLAKLSFGVDDWIVTDESLREKVVELGDEPVTEIAIPILVGSSFSDVKPNFGELRSGGRRHEGIDIIGPSGAPIVSPTEAVVLKVGYGSSAGYYVYTGNPGGEIFAYMHLKEPSTLAPGDSLDEGDLIGYVGKTGNAKGSSSHLHFEIRKNGPMDPSGRIMKEFSVEERLAFLEDIMEDEKDREESSRKLALVKNETDADLPDMDLKLGARGEAVKKLQKFLIDQNVGIAVAKLAKAGATGYFGEVTKQALAEYQDSAGIKPASGYYGRITRAYIASNM